MAKKSKPGTPVMIGCPRCEGDGEIQATCNNCGVPLTEENQADAGSEGLCDDMCAKCWAKDLKADANESEK